MRPCQSVASALLPTFGERPPEARRRTHRGPPSYSPPVPRCRADTSIERVVIDGFSFPLGVYPVEAMTPKQGYTVEFEPSDGGEDADPGDRGSDGGTAEEPDREGAGGAGAAGSGWEEWPDRYVFDIVLSAERVEPLVKALLALLPGRIYPILDYLGLDAYREVDPYISYELVGMERFIDALRRYRAFFFEDGLCGFGAMIDEPFLYVFVDEHKIITVRAEPELKEKIEKLLAAFDLEPTEHPAGADSASHEHRAVLVTADDRPDLLTVDEIVEHLRDEWRLVLNVDPDTNLDEEGHDLGLTPWHCLIRVAAEGEEKSRYAEAVLMADCLRTAEELAMEAVESLRPENIEEWEDIFVVASDRLSDETLAETLKTRGHTKPVSKEEGLIWCGWLE